MNKQFTASEVRGQIAWLRNVTVVGTKTTYQMLDAFADLLEAQEKAVPIYQLMATDDSWWDVSRELYEAEGGHAGRTRILYTHTAPSYPERLAEALLRNWFNLLCHAGIDAREEKANSTLHRIMDIAKQVSSEIAKYENVAQAQPPVQSKYAPPYPEQAQDPFWEVPGMVDTRPKAQPPAASVTDEMVDAALTRAVIASKKSGIKGPTRYMMRAALEAALAAQENPNC